MRRSLLLATTIAAVTLALGAPVASAGKPFSGSFSTSFDAQVDGICAFPFAIHTEFTQDWRTWALGGDVYRQIGHLTIQDTFTANGRTLVGDPIGIMNVMEYLQNETDFQLYSSVASGQVEKVRTPDGRLVFLSAGRIDFMAHPGEPVLLTPDNGRSGDFGALCAALAA